MKQRRFEGNGIAKVHWGEIFEEEIDSSDTVIPDEFIENIWREATADFYSEDHSEDDNKPEIYEITCGDPRVHNMIHLHSQLIEMENSLNNKPVAKSRKRKFNDSFNNDCSSESQQERCKVNKSAKMPRLESSSVDVLLENVTITSLMHLGFVSASDIAVETLTDLIAMFLRKITLSLKHASEQTNNGFPDALEQVLVGSGTTGGIADLHNFYKEYIVNYEAKLNREVKMMTERKKQLEIKETDCDSIKVPRMFDTSNIENYPNNFNK